MAGDEMISVVPALCGAAGVPAGGVGVAVATASMATDHSTCGVAVLTTMPPPAPELLTSRRNFGHAAPGVVVDSLPPPLQPTRTIIAATTRAIRRIFIPPDLSQHI